MPELKLNCDGEPCPDGESFLSVDQGADNSYEVTIFTDKRDFVGLNELGIYVIDSAENLQSNTLIVDVRISDPCDD